MTITMTSDFGTPIDEIQCSPSVVPEQVYGADSPLILRGLVADWLIVKAAKESNQSVVEYVKKFYNGRPVNAFMAAPEVNGRIFYNESVNGFNFVQSQVYLDDALNRVLQIEGQQDQPTYYVGSLQISQHLPGLSEDTPLDLERSGVRQSIWLGNQSVIAPHFDVPDNLACCVIGERKFTLFPPEQHANLYVGPLDFTPAGQPISMVNIQDPDLEKYPRFSRAMDSAKTATLLPGDAIYIPSMWWHSVQSLSALNGLVNYWWREVPAYMGDPNNALFHSILSIKQLPMQQRKAWQALFEHYVFEQPEELHAHLPEQIKQQQNQMTESIARKLRTQLVNKLK